MLVVTIKNEIKASIRDWLCSTVEEATTYNAGITYGYRFEFQLLHF